MSKKTTGEFLKQGAKGNQGFCGRVFPDVGERTTRFMFPPVYHHGLPLSVRAHTFCQEELGMDHCQGFRTEYSFSLDMVMEDKHSITALRKLQFPLTCLETMLLQDMFQ